MTACAGIKQMLERAAQAYLAVLGSGCDRLVFQPDQ
jgi:hypothetical protein